MAENRNINPDIRPNRPPQVIKSTIVPLDTSLKIKLANAMQLVVTKIKDKHMG
jgi:hypothetical protein